MNTPQPETPRKYDPVIHDLTVWCLRCIICGAIILVTSCLLSFFIFLFKSFVYFLR